MSMRPFLLPVLLCSLLAAPAARAVEVRLNLGADWWVEPQRAIFPLQISLGAQVSRALELGGRFGAYVVTPNTQVGVPADFFLRVEVPRTPLYFEGLVGPWFLFDSSEFVRPHAAVGFGADLGGVSLGLEAGYLYPSGMIGLKLGFNL
jgi:hypothetical protein